MKRYLFYRFVLIFAFILINIFNMKHGWAADKSPNEYDFGKLTYLISKKNTGDNDSVTIYYEIDLRKNWRIYFAQKNNNIFHVKNSGKYLYKVRNIFPAYDKSINQFGEIDYFFTDKFTIFTEMEFKKDRDSYAQNIVKSELNFIACNETCIPYNLSFTHHINQDETLVKNNDSTLKTQLIWLISAFFAGLLFNVMPCVLPILLLKINSIINTQESTESKLATRKKLLYTALGGIISFLSIAALTCLFSKTGEIFGWGMHFQNPYFTIFIIVIMMIFALITWDKRTFAITIPAYFDKVKYANDIRYMSEGVITAILATSCSTAIIGGVFTFALTQSPYMIFLLFTLTGIGLMFPYLILAIKPSILQPLSRMRKVKLLNHKLFNMQFSTGLTAFLISIWFLYILSLQLSNSAAIILFGLMIIFKFSLQISSRFSTIKSIILSFIFIACFILPIKFYHNQKEQVKIYDQTWEEFDEKKLEAYRQNKKIILVDITATWCFNCKVNHFWTLEPFVKNLPKDSQLILMRKDITSGSYPEINHFIHSYERSGIPFNAIYHKDKYIILPTIFTIKELKNAIVQIEKMG